jgi:hypothetical protein
MQLQETQQREHDHPKTPRAMPTHAEKNRAGAARIISFKTSQYRRFLACTTAQLVDPDLALCPVGCGLWVVR